MTMIRPSALLALSTVALIGSLVGDSQKVRAGNDTEVKGAGIYCYMRSSGNDHKVSWNAAYAVIKRQNKSLLKTSPEHASVMITEAVVQDPGKFPDCGQFLGDLFGGNSSKVSPSSFDNSTETANTAAINTSDVMESDDRYSY